MVENTINNLSLCSGVAGLELGLDLAFKNIKTVCHVEGEAYAASILAQKMEEGTLHDAPIWDNVRTFDAKPWRGRVHSISGGFPCQPFSQAGNQLAENDPRHLWPEFIRIIGEVRPNFIFLENVPGVVKLAAPTIFTDLAEMGYNASWCVIKASDVGALHHRARWFCLAWKNGDDADPDIESLISAPDREFKEAPGLSKNVGDVADSECDGCSKNRKRNRSCLLAGKCQEMEKERHKQAFSITNGSSNKRNKPDQKPVCDQFNQDWWKVEPGMGRMVDGVADWVDRIRACGNGVVPAQAAEAFTILYEQYENFQ